MGNINVFKIILMNILRSSLNIIREIFLLTKTRYLQTFTLHHHKLTVPFLCLVTEIAHHHHRVHEGLGVFPVH